MKNKSLFLMAAILSIAMRIDAQETGAFTDSRDGKIYKTVKIDTQTWMAENLAFKANSGTCLAYENVEPFVAKFGYLYDWETAKMVCPLSWHLPSDAEWTKLINYLGGEDFAGGKLKEKGTVYWSNPNKGATNEVGFSALPGGSSYSKNSFSGLGSSTYFWSSTESTTKDAYFIGILYDFEFINKSPDNKNYGSSVRCIKD